MMFRILSLLLLTSCSLFINNIEQDILEKNDVTPLSETEKTTCEIVQKKILISENKASQKSFNSFLDKLSKSKSFKFIDKAVLWSLLQINLRPDLSSPTAKLQVILKINGKEEYLNSYSNSTDRFPYLKALDQLLKKHKSKFSLLDLSLLIDKKFNETLYVSLGFEQFLVKNKSRIIQSSSLEKTFIRGDESLKQNERIPKLNISRWVKKYFKFKSSKSYQLNSFLFSYKDDSPIESLCNFDMGLYNDSLFLINEKKIQSHIYGIKIKKNSFMAISSQDISNFKTLKNTFLFTGNSNIRSASLCSFKNKRKKDDSLWLVSTDSRDPGQHLFHLLQYGVDSVKSSSDLNSMLRFSRHQFLKNPVRLIIESRRSSKNQLNELLKLNIPIYNSKKLGKIWGYYQGSKKSSFILDDRRQGHLECNSM